MQIQYDMLYLNTMSIEFIADSKIQAQGASPMAGVPLFSYEDLAGTLRRARKFNEDSSNTRAEYLGGSLKISRK